MFSAFGTFPATRMGMCVMFLWPAWLVGIAHADHDEGRMIESALTALRQVVADQAGWDKVHAGEFLLSLGYDKADVCQRFQREAELHENDAPYRIGVWRVLATGDCSPGHAHWVERIRDVAFDVDAKDQLFAIESLCKLDYQPTDVEQKTLRDYVLQHPPAEAVYARWLLALGGSEGEVDAILGELQHSEAMVRLRAGAVLGRLGDLSEKHWRQLADAALREQEGSIARIHLAAAAWARAPTDAPMGEMESILTAMLQSADPAERKYAAEAFARRGDQEHLHLLIPLLDDEDADVRAYAGLAALRMIRRIPRTISSLDWAVIVAYAVGMLFIGWHFSRQTGTTDDFHLGGRNQRPWAVGLSLFATLLSTLSYMAYPGEVIKHGPMMLAGMFAYPLIFMIVGFGIIPLIMRQRVTSAYEILEIKLGLGPRLLGSAIFIMIRLTWMAAVIHITSTIIIVPIMGIEPVWSPLVGGTIGIITLVYTSLGGLRAVIWTDVLQSIILFVGALLTIALVSFQLGGFGWFPMQWAADWDPPVIGFDTNARITLSSAFVMMLGWYVCTAGSDQMAMQRYLATRDAPAARRMYGISLIAATIVTLLLMCVGFALLAYFKANPAMLPDGQTIDHAADQLFPRYIVIALPAGIAGLVVAGLLAAAMSSLSSGISSAAAVIQVDFLQRLLAQAPHKATNVRTAKWTSVAVGVAVVLLSLSIGQVKGNLLEVVNKVANLMTAPLFLLFFMSLFIPWARGGATIVATMSSIFVAVAIAYFEVFGLSFIWIIPASLFVGGVLGAGLSLAPIGPTARTRSMSDGSRGVSIEGTRTLPLDCDAD